MHTRSLNDNTHPPSTLLPWLVHPYSITEKLKERFGEARLHVLHQGWHHTRWWEKYALDLDHQTILQRDIMMFSNQIPCWFARSIIPKLTYTANESLFLRLKTESLGNIIFNDDTIVRQSMTHYPITKQCLEYYWPNAAWVNNAPILWLRSSHYLIKDQFPFFLSEIFLPEWTRILV
jgi:chorismate--pyruvate lyase